MLSAVQIIRPARCQLVRLGYLRTLLATVLVLGAAQTSANSATLKAVLGGDLQVLDPIVSPSYPTRTFGYLVYDTLISRSSAGEYKPQMLKSWEVSADNKVYTFTLRDGLKWSSGGPVTAADCVASIKRWAKRDGLGGQLMAATASLEAKDATTFVLTLSQPFGLVLDALGKEGSPVPFMMPSRLAETEATKALTEVDGSGPFIFKREAFVPGNVAVFLPNPNYKPRDEPADGLAGGKVAKVDQVQLVSMADPATQASALQTGEIDFIQYPSFDLLPILKGAPNVKVEDPGPAAGNTGFIVLNHLQPPLTDERVRRAFALAINRRDVMASVGIPADNMKVNCVSMFYCGGPYQAAKGGENLMGDTTSAASALLKEAGYQGEEIVLMTQSTGITAAAIPVVVSQLRKAGFKVRQDIVELNTLFERRGKKSKISEGGWSAFMVFLGAVDTTSPATHLYINNNCNPNYSGWACDEEMKALQAEFRAELDLSKRQAIAEKINQRAHLGVPAAIWGAFAAPVAYNSALKGLIVKSPFPVFWNVEKK